MIVIKIKYKPHALTVEPIGLWFGNLRTEKPSHATAQKPQAGSPVLGLQTEVDKQALQDTDDSCRHTFSVLCHQLDDHRKHAWLKESHLHFTLDGCHDYSLSSQPTIQLGRPLLQLEYQHTAHGVLDYYLVPVEGLSCAHLRDSADVQNQRIDLSELDLLQCPLLIQLQDLSMH